MMMTSVRANGIDIRYRIEGSGPWLTDPAQWGQAYLWRT